MAHAWKACWGQPLKSSNLLSSAIVTSRFQSTNPAAAVLAPVASLISVSVIRLRWEAWPATPPSGPRGVFHRGQALLCTGFRRALPQLVAAACQVGGLGGVACQLDGFAVGRARLLTAAEPAQQLGAGRMVGVIAGQLVLKTVDGRQCHLRAVELGDRDGPVEGDDRRGVEADELVVEGDDLRPVGVTYVAGGGVHGADRCEDLVATRSHPGGQALAHQPVTLGDQRGVPGPTVLLDEGDQFAARRNPGGAAGLGEEHQRQQPGHLTVLRHERTDQASEPDRLGDQVVTYGIGVGAGRQVALVEDEEEDGEYAADACREILRGRDRYGIRAALILAFARVIRWPMALSCTRKARAISGTVSPPIMRSVSATRVCIAS